ncbi:MAG: peroxiredoxin family protein [Acidimicrobiia bacterium]|nr:peroxiredoxin family protein [Acidimicrobiia bacterium]MDH4365078.1 peroxiredoxin family protein [Acidimicrobiia bacterium]
MLVDTLDVTPARFHADTGWEIKPEGACRGDVCVPLPDGFSLTGAAERLGMALVEEPAHGLWAVGPESVTGRALVSAEAPELELADLDGRTWRLSSLRGQKVVLVAWAPY